ncbi:MAG: OpgC domain-containing protein [Pseudomonadota bacterium]
MQPASLRDVRLDVFRGLAMFIIFVAHIPTSNVWHGYLPRELGPTDAAEWFVFCSGFASALAFGKVFEQQGWLLGTSRILHRVWQLYWSHLSVFFIVAAICVIGTWWLGTVNYLIRLNLMPFFDNPERGLVHLMTLTYVPNLFDILPMYMTVLLMLPIVVALSRIHVGVAMTASVLLYLAARQFDLHFSAEWWSDRPWYFNPLAWQLLFFTGFAFGRGWLHRPPATAPWLLLAGAIVLVLFVLDFRPIWENVAAVGAISHAHLWMIEKTDFGPARYLHLLATAYLALVLLDRYPGLLRSPVTGPLVLVGQQTLPVFLSTMVLSWTAGMALDVVGNSFLKDTAVVLTGFLAMLAVAKIAAFYKSQPWRRPRHPLAAQGEPRGEARPGLIPAGGD